MGERTRFTNRMNIVSLLVVLFAVAASAEDEVARKPKLFFVSTSATTTTLQTLSFATCHPVRPPHALEGRGGPSTWMGGCPSKRQLRSNLNLHNQILCQQCPLHCSWIQQLSNIRLNQ